MYYDALLSKLSFDSPNKKLPICAREYYKSSVEGFLDEQRKRQEKGEQPYAIIFYRGFTDEEINKLVTTVRSDSWSDNF
jgi:intein-encoded DNA endonuclease-like protein